MEKISAVLDDKLYWYKDAIIYELHIKAFNDGNDDGIGDFKGLLEKLDYLQELGITAIWVLPFYPSPLRDDSYDIADYYNINPSYGDIERNIANLFTREGNIQFELRTGQPSGFGNNSATFNTDNFKIAIEVKRYSTIKQHISLQSIKSLPI